MAISPAVCAVESPPGPSSALSVSWRSVAGDEDAKVGLWRMSWRRVESRGRFGAGFEVEDGRWMKPSRNGSVWSSSA